MPRKKKILLPTEETEAGKVYGIKETSKLVFDLHALQVDYSKEREDALIEEISQKYGVPKSRIELNFVPIIFNSEGENVSMSQEIIENIQDPKFQIELFKDYLATHYQPEDYDFEAIKSIDEEVNTYVDFEMYKKYKRYKFKYVRWSNYLSYGPDNYFDFTNLHGLVLLNGYPENQCGKTTFAISLLRFALFGKSDKTPTLDSVFNVYLPNENEVKVEVCIEVEGVDYVIRRTITRPKKRTKSSKASQVVEYFRMVDGKSELLENCQDESVGKTNKLIQECVGTPDDFDLVMSATSRSLGDLLRMGQADKGKLFSRWLGLLSIEKKEQVAKDLYNKKVEPTFESKRYNRSVLEADIENFTQVIANRESNIEEASKKEAECEENMKKIDAERVEALASKKQVNPELEKYDVSTIEMRKKNNEENLARKRAEFTPLKQDYIDRLSKIEDSDRSAIDEKRNENSELIREIERCRSEVISIRNENERIRKMMEQKICPTCGQPIDMQQKIGQINENKLKEKELYDKGITLSKKKAENEETIKKMEEAHRLYEEKARAKLKLSAIKETIDGLKIKIANDEQKIQEYETNRENLKWNNEANLKYESLSVSYRNEQKIKEGLIRDIQNYKRDIETYKREIDNRKKLIEKIIKEEKIQSDWAKYKELVGRNGIVKMVLRRALPLINNELERLLNGLCDFKVVMSVTPDNKVCLNISRDGQELDFTFAGSGFEETMASLALRAALGNMATMPKPNFIVLDEIINVIGNYNMENLHKLLDRIMVNYDFVLHITHLESIYDWHTSVITVYKDNNISKL